MPANPTRAEMEASFRSLLADAGMQQPDEVCPHEDGGIVCLWHEEKLAVVIDPDREGESYTYPV